MLSYSLGLSKIHKSNSKNMEPTQPRSHTSSAFYLKHNRPTFIFNYTSNHLSTSQGPKKYGTLSSARDHVQNIRLSQANTKQNHSNQISLRLERTCLTEPQAESYSARSTSRSRTKKRKTARNLFNFSVEKVKKDNTSKDKYIQSFISMNHSNFLSSSKSQQKSKTQLMNTSVDDQPIESVLKDSTNSIEGIAKQTKYQKIRQKMRKLKNLTSEKRFKRKTYNQNMTEQEWNQIEKIVKLACKEQIGKRLDTEETMETNMRETNSEIDQMGSRELNGESEKVKKQENRNATLQDNSQLTKIGKLLEGKNKSQQNKEILTPKQKSSIHQTSHSEINSLLTFQKFQSSNNLESSSQCNLSFPQFYSLLLIYEHVLYSLPEIIQKLTQLCIEYSLQYKPAIFLFFKQTYLSKKLIELCISQKQIFQHNQQTYDYSIVIQQIRKTNTKNLMLLKKMKDDYQQDLIEKMDKEISESTSEDESIESLSQHITCLEKDFLASNMKIIKKLLKKISKSPKTNIRHFQTFLNYSSCFLNLSRAHQNINQIIENSFSIEQTKLNSLSLIGDTKNPLEEEKQSLTIKQFLLLDCHFVENKYLQVKEKVFQMFFDIEDEHQKIQDYYHVLIKELKQIQSKNKDLKQ